MFLKARAALGTRSVGSLSAGKESHEVGGRESGRRRCRCGCVSRLAPLPATSCIQGSAARGNSEYVSVSKPRNVMDKEMDPDAVPEDVADAFLLLVYEWDV